MASRTVAAMSPSHRRTHDPRFTANHQDIDVEADEFGGERGRSVRHAVQVPVLDDHALALDVAKLT